MNFSQNSTLAQLRAWLLSKADDGATCPVCTQNVKVYRRKVNSGMARSLIAMHVVGGRDWVHVPTQIGARSREEGKLAYWGLVEEEKALRPDDGRTGYWRVTELGERFVKNQTTIPKYVRVYNGRVLGHDPVGRVGILDALGDGFNYRDLMAGV